MKSWRVATPRNRSCKTGFQEGRRRTRRAERNGRGCLSMLKLRRGDLEVVPTGCEIHASQDVIHVPGASLDRGRVPQVGSQEGAALRSQREQVENSKEEADDVRDCRSLRRGLPALDARAGEAPA